MTKAMKTRILTPEQLPLLRHELPKSWVRAAGLLRHKRKALERHLRQVRQEWNRHPRAA